MSVAFSPSGKWVASGGLDGLVNIFDVGVSNLRLTNTTAAATTVLPFVYGNIRTPLREKAPALHKERPCKPASRDLPGKVLAGTRRLPRKETC